jgi:hypothetical protein
MYAADGSKFLAVIGIGAEPLLEGYSIDGRITDILRMATNTRILDQREEVDGHTCFVLTGSRSPFGRYTLWCDPNCGYMPRKILIEKSGDDTVGGRRIANMRYVTEGNRPVNLSKLVYTVDSMRFQQFGAAFLPIECRMTTRHEYVDGNWHVMDDTCKREKVELKPDLKGAFQPNLPNGFRLTNLETPNAPYEWRDGRPMPLPNESH